MSKAIRVIECDHAGCFARAAQGECMDGWALIGARNPDGTSALVHYSYCGHHASDIAKHVDRT